MKTPVETLLAVVDIGGQLGVAGDKLRMLLPADCNPILKEAIRAHKAALLELLHVRWWIVRSDVLAQTVIWSDNEKDRQKLIQHGAPDGCVYSRQELATLVQSKPDGEALRLIHKAKRDLGGSIRENP